MDKVNACKVSHHATAYIPKLDDYELPTQVPLDPKKMKPNRFAGKVKFMQENAVIITPERPDAPDARALIEELDAVLEPLYPSASRHGFSVEKLIADKVAFFVARYEGVAASCGGIKFFGNEYGEIKRMFVRPQFRGMGLAKLMLEHLENFARERGITLLRLETGIHQGAAIALYEQMGFRRIAPFGDYTDDPVSRCYEKRIL